jgi:FkbM family methyltransferase
MTGQPPSATTPTLPAKGDSLMMMARRLLDRVPALQKPAYHAYVGAMAVKQAVHRNAYLKYNRVPKYLSDRGQDRWVIDEVFHGKRGGFFVEFGAFDGFTDSNTFILEKRFGWGGLTIEPNPENFRKMTEVYKRGCTCVPLAVDAEPGTLEFVTDGQRSGLITKEGDYADTALTAAARAEGRIVTVDVLPLADVLDRYGAPSTIDYLSLDVEGLETRVMRHFPFDRYRFLAMTVERPTPELNRILFANQYHFVRNSLYDSFYVHESLPNFAAIPKMPFEQLPAKAF